MVEIIPVSVVNALVKVLGKFTWAWWYVFLHTTLCAEETYLGCFAPSQLKHLNALRAIDTFIDFSVVIPLTSELDLIALKSCGVAVVLRLDKSEFGDKRLIWNIWRKYVRWNTCKPVGCLLFFSFFLTFRFQRALSKEIF